jgi:hypothetical protein
MPKVKTLQYVEKILGKIKIFEHSCMDFNWGWQVKENADGFLIRASFDRLDVYKNEISKGYGRWMHTEKDVTESGIVKTAWLCTELIVRHEMMEAFQYRNAKILNPHKSVKDLAYPKELE